MHASQWLSDKLRTLAHGDDNDESIYMRAAADVIDRLEGEIRHVRENWERLENAPENTPEQVAMNFVEYELTNRTLALNEDYKRDGFIARLSGVIERARVDGGIAAKRDT